MRNLLRKVLLMLAITVIIFSLASCTLVEDMPGLVDQLLGNTDEHEHAFSDATCTTPATCECGETEGEALGHSFNEGKCACGAEDPNYVAPHEHTFVEGKCECGESDPNYVPPHTHTFVEGKCECGESDPNYVPPHTHNFVEGKCECGESDPNYVPPHTHTFVEGKCGQHCGQPYSYSFC